MGIWFKTKCVVLVESVYFNGIEFAMKSGSGRPGAYQFFYTSSPQAIA